MTHAAILSPMFAMFALTFIVWAYMYAKRIPFITNTDFGDEGITPARLVELSPPSVSNPSDNLKNLFELPVLFYAVCLYLHVTGQSDGLYQLAAWAFVGLRVVHSAVHCTVNIVLLRFWIYFAASVMLWFMIARAALAQFG